MISLTSGSGFYRRVWLNFRSMSEDTQKQMEFIVEHQARLAVNQERADERLTRLEKIVANAYVDMRDRYNALVDAQLKSETKIAAVAEAQLRLTEAQQSLMEGQQHTDNRLNALIEIVDRHITGHDNGKQR